VNDPTGSPAEQAPALRVVRADTANHYTWGPGAEGWRLLDGHDLSVIEELVPPGGAETLHEHRYARQFFYVISGQAEMTAGSRTWTLGVGDGFEVPPGVSHEFANVGATDVRFLVISSPPSRGDRTEVSDPLAGT